MNNKTSDMALLNLSTVFADKMRDHLEEMDQKIANFAGSLLQKVSDDYGLSFDELKERYMGEKEFVPVPIKVKGKKERKPIDTDKENRCIGLTAKGQPCAFTACSGSNMCKIHIKKTGSRMPEATPIVESSEPKKRGRKPKAKKETPQHNHSIGEDPDSLCKLCDSHGDVVDPELPNKRFEEVPTESELCDTGVDASVPNKNFEEVPVESDGLSLNEKLKALLAAHDEGYDEDELSAIMSKVKIGNGDEDMDDEELAEFEEQAETPPSMAKLAEIKKAKGFGGYSMSELNKGFEMEELDEDV